jgi:hypothetical protein
MFYADFPRHLSKQIARALIAHPTADTVELADWAYGVGPHPTWHRWNVIRACRMFGIRPIGRVNRRLVWSLHRLED